MTSQTNCPATQYSCALQGIYFNNEMIRLLIKVDCHATLAMTAIRVDDAHYATASSAPVPRAYKSAW